jgi:phospholipid-binding lipoprotein MlaA
MSLPIRTVVLVIAFALGGCATTNPKDPFEPFNRAMFTFNDTVDQAALKPAAQVYSTLPTFVQTGIGNFFGNLGDVWTAVNNLLQGKIADGMSDVMRFAVNTTLGLGGLLDIGSEAGLQKHKEDFGQTLGQWGVKSGPYVVLPILGPSTLRDTIATPLDLSADPWAYKDPIRWRNAGYLVRIVDQRAAVLDASNLLEEAALDRYEFVRDAYLQRRESKIHDGETTKPSYHDEGLSNPLAEDAARDGKTPVQSEEPSAKPIVKTELNGTEINRTELKETAPKATDQTSGGSAGSAIAVTEKK